ncbi:DUF4886 domain-containing protein [Sunxiuqinia sp. A32]|uniref:DUF4886 domain-containing protein n=1 Tax=Sunxiuqinia sp. A32 TaxID=3461496 RepID=UPI0040458ABF
MVNIKFLVTTLIFISNIFFSEISFAGGVSKNDQVQLVRLLAIGNSFSDNACRYLSQITQSVDSCDILIGRAMIGGCSLEKHAKLIDACEQDSSLKPYEGKTLKEILQQEEWDVVTIQQVSYLSFKKESFQPYADQIYAFVEEYAPQARIYIHETWAYGPDCARFEKFGITMKQMYRKLKKNYRSLARHFNTPILPSGDAFYNSYKGDNKIDLWDSKDRFHASSNGCYLAGCVWFHCIFEQPSNSISFKPDDMPAKTAKYLQTVAHISSENSVKAEYQSQ